MCNYIGIRVSKKQLIQLKKIEKQWGILAALKELQSGFEYGNWGIIKANADKTDIDISLAHWEFIPPWIKDTTALKAARKQGIPWLNATAEKLLDSKMFRDAAINRRCLVPISFFYEWRHYKHIGGKKAITYPYCISRKNDEIFYLAGIYQPWLDKETGELQDSFAIVTTKANETMAQIHNTKMRMPTMLREDLAYEWIMEDLTEERIAEIAAFQLPSYEILAHTINKDFRIAENPTDKFMYEELPALQ